MRSVRGTRGDYRHYPPEYLEAGVGCSIDRSNPLHPVLSIDAVLEIQGSSHITVDSTDPRKPILSTSGLVDKVHGTDQIIVDNTDEDNPIVKTTGLVESVTGAGAGLIQLDNSDTRNPKMVFGKSGRRRFYLDSDYTVPTSGSDHVLPLKHYIDKGATVKPPVLDSSGTGRINFPYDGVYLIEASFQLKDATAATTSTIKVYGHDDRYRFMEIPKSSKVSLTYSFIRFVNSGSYLEHRINSSGTSYVYGHAHWNSSIEFLRLYG